MRATLVLAVCLAAVAALPRDVKEARINGGNLISISQYPSIVSLMYSWNSNSFWHTCTGTIINARSILTTAQCAAGDAASRWRARTGSTFSNSGGLTLVVASIIIHTGYDGRTYDNDIGILRTSTNMAFYEDVMPSSFATSNSNPSDNELVWIPGWGFITSGGSPSEQLREVQTKIINHDLCVERYHSIDETVTENMLCSGWLNSSGRGQCQGDEGSPLFHNKIVVGIYSWGRGCGRSYFPIVNVRLSRYVIWIHANA